MGQSCAGQVAIVTGASRGIGQAIAVRLAAEGAKVALLGRHAASRRTDLPGSLDEGVARITATGGTAQAWHADLDDLTFDTAALMAGVVDAFGRWPDILVHSAAAPREWGKGWVIPFSEITPDQFLRSVMTNVWGGWRMAQSVLPGMRAQGAGHVVFISSSAAAPVATPSSEAYAARMRATGGGALYGGTKAFLDRICTAAALELYPDNIAVNSLSTTGAVVTPQLSFSVGTPTGEPEPIEAFVEATLALATGDPRSLTSRTVHSLPLLYELQRPVYTLDGTELFAGWQPDRDDPRRFMQHYLKPTGH